MKITSIVQKAVKSILEHAKVDYKHDIPYLAGYSINGKTIYIDRHIPRLIKIGNKNINVSPFLILHESVEKALIDELGLRYQEAHQIALMVEKEAVEKSGINWTSYDKEMQKYIKEIGHEKLTNVPKDLDLTPYKDEKDYKILKDLQK